MDFDELLAKILQLLQQEQRLSYRALKRRFALDDEYLEDIKAELIQAKQVARDEAGAVLVWTGSGDTPPAPPPPPAAGEAQPAWVAHSTATPPAPEAERRQLTVMFCDVVDSTRLSSQLDPEEYRDVVRAYQATCTEVIRRYDGHIAQLLGDGLLIYFGYPQAHEDDAQRAVRAGLGIVEAIGTLKTSLAQTTGIALAVRLGIHTGLVVIGALGDQGRHEHLALGETPNIAARIQGLAQPNTVAISDATSRLVQGYFACQDLGAHALRGVPEAMRLYQVLRVSGATSRLDVAQPRGLTPLVGRESEVTLLLERWEQAKAGHGHVVLLSGDGGIGKSRLVHTLKDHVANEPHMRWECRSAEYYQNTALFPLTDLFPRLLQFHAEDTLDTKVAKLERALSQYRLPLEETVPLFAPLLSLPLPQDRYPLLNVSPQRQRQKTLETIVAILLELAERQPVLFIVEDLHWTDPTTLELLNLVIEQTPTASLLTVPTCRPHFQPSWHHRSYITEMTLNHLSHMQVDQIVTGMTDGKAFPPEVLQQIMAKTDGVPLFVEEITKAILESGQLTTVDGHYAVIGSFATFTIPATLHDSLMARLDRLVTAKAVAQYAAVIGRQFPYDLLHAVSHLDEAMLQHELGRLVEAEIVFQRGLPPQATYTFKHALIQEAAYQSLLKSTRQQYHQRIAQVLEARFPALCATQPELLAHHYTEAGLSAQALPYWQRAGERALQRSANLEAISHLTRGLEVLASLPEYPEGAQQELMCLIPLGVSLTATQGFGAPEAGRVYARARALCQQLGDTSQLFQVLRGLQVFHLLRAELQTARDLGEQLLSLARRQQDPLYLMMAHQVLGGVLFWLGELAPAHAELEQGIARYQPQQHRAMAASYGVDNGVVGYCYAAWVLWSLGYPDQAVQRSRVALTLAQEGAHPYSLAFALNWAATLQMLLRQGQATQEWAEATISQTSEHGFPLYLAFSTVLRGWALARQSQGAEGIEHIHQGLAAYRATGAALAQPWHLALLAEAYQHAGQTEAGLAALAEALTAVHNTGERVYEAELYRLQGALRLAQSPDYAAEAEACFHRALDVARAQQAKSWELRAAMSLSRLWQQQGRRAEAHALLAPVYGWFTEGFDTADLQEAKALLDELAG